MPPRPPSVSVSKDTVEASATAIEEENERLHSLPRDDRDDDMAEEELEELFGCGAGGGDGAGDPIDLDGPEGGGGEDQGDENNDSTMSRPSTSDVWNDFKLFRLNDKGKEVRYGAVCNYCHKEYSGLSTSGTGHLHRHRAKCPKLREKTRGWSQTQIFQC